MKLLSIPLNYCFQEQQQIANFDALEGSFEICYMCLKYSFLSCGRKDSMASN